MADGSSLFLYSTNVFMKYWIQERYANGRHYVWCSSYFDSSKHGAYSDAYGIAASSNPAVLYRRYKQDLESGDTHSSMIEKQKAGIKARAAEWLGAGKISEEDLEDIVTMVDLDRRDDWRPLIYIINRNLVSDRLERVPARERAGIGLEYRISDLTRDEFDLIEV